MLVAPSSLLFRPGTVANCPLDGRSIGWHEGHARSLGADSRRVTRRHRPQFVPPLLDRFKEFLGRNGDAHAVGPGLGTIGADLVLLHRSDAY